MLINDNDYFAILNQIKQQIKMAQYRAVQNINLEQIVLYWNVGKTISDNVKYGNKFVENLARDIKQEYPNAKGYSVRNLNYMKKFAELVTDEQILQTLSAKLSWSHNILLIIKIKDLSVYCWYAGKLNFYLSAIDDMLKHPQNNPTIGIMLCKTRDKLTAEYALKDINKPMGVSEYKLSDFVPAEFADTLPSAEDIEKRVKEKFDIND